jgi:zinc protease
MSPVATAGVVEHQIHSIPFGQSGVHDFRLANGLTLLVWEDHCAPVAACQLWFRVGSADEARGQTGIAHLLEHLMFKGTRRYPEGVFDRTLESHGVSINASTWLDWTCYTSSLPSENLPLVLELEADRVAGLRFSEKAFRTERDVVLNERRMSVDNDPEGLASEVLFSRHFGDHPYGNPTVGWMADLEVMTRADCLRFHRTWYSPGNLILVVTGDVDSREVLALTQRYFGGFKGVPAPVRPTHSLHPVPGKTEVLLQPVAATRISGLAMAPALGAPGWVEASVLEQILYQAEHAHLTTFLVDDREFATDLDGSYMGLRQAGLMEWAASLTPGIGWNRFLKAMDTRLARFLNHGVSSRELLGARNRIKTAYMKANVDQTARCQSLGLFQATLGSITPFLQFPSLLSQVCVDSLMQVAREIFHPDRRTLVVLAPKEENTGPVRGGTL